MKVGVALAGGGLKGLAHVGALKALEELGVKIDYLSGTSSGSIFASAYALGFTPEEIKDRTLKYYKNLTKIPKRPILKAGTTYISSGVAKIEGLIPGENIENVVDKFASEKHILTMDRLKMPYAIASVDTITTKEIIFSSVKINTKNDDIEYVYGAPIATATRASMSFPGVYTPCQYNQYNCIDGGTKDNLPVHVLKDMGADVTIALSFKIDDYVPKEDIFAVLLRACDIFSLKDVRKAQKEADIAIEINCPGTSLLEITNADDVIKIGYDTVMQYKKEILKLVK